MGRRVNNNHRCEGWFHLDHDAKPAPSVELVIAVACSRNGRLWSMLQLSATGPGRALRRPRRRSCRARPDRLGACKIGLPTEIPAGTQFSQRPSLEHIFQDELAIAVSHSAAMKRRLPSASNPAIGSPSGLVTTTNDNNMYRSAIPAKLSTTQIVDTMSRQIPRAAKPAPLARRLMLSFLPGLVLIGRAGDIPTQACDTGGPSEGRSCRSARSWR